MLILPRACSDSATIEFGIKYESLSFGSRSILFMYILFYNYIVL